MANENVSINIDSKADLRGFKQAESAASKLNKTVKGLAATLGIAYGARAVTNFGKAAVKAFTDDQKSATKLAIAVKNLGLAFEQANVEGFISDLEKSAAIADDLLRPAFQALLTTTGDFAKSQELLQTAVNVSRGSGEQLITVAKDLSNAYVGNTRGLRKYYLGLNQTQLKEMSFLKIQEKLNKQFSGASAAYLATYSGKMEALTTAAGRAQETIGGALVDALINVSGAGDIDGVVDKIDGLAAAGVKAISTMDVLAQSLYFSAFKQSPLEFFGFTNSGVERFAKIIEEQRRAAQYAGAAPYNPKDNALTGYKASEKAAKKAREEAAKNAKIQAAFQKKQLEAAKKAEALKKAGTIFDLEQIQRIAALKGEISEEDKKRVQAQLALLNDNAVLATKLTKEILMAEDSTGKLYQYFQSIPDAKNPFGYLDEWIKAFQTKLNSLQFPTPNGGSVTVPTSSLPPITQADVNRILAPTSDRGISTSREYFEGIGMKATNVADVPKIPATGASVMENYRLNQITVQIDGKEIAAVVQNQALNGNASTINRAQGNF